MFVIPSYHFVDTSIDMAEDLMPDKKDLSVSEYLN